MPATFRGKTVWLRADGINYRAELWLNGHLVGSTKGMFMRNDIDVTDYVTPGARNVLAVKVLPVDMPGSTSLKPWGAPGEFRNGGNGDIGLNTTMLMSVGWDFTFMDGIRDRNTGIWRDISLYTTGKIALRNPFVKSELAHPGYDKYEGANTLTGPCVSGFESLQSMPRTKVKSAVHMRREGDRIFFDVALRNPTSKIAFFNRLQLTDAKRHPVRPSFYSDNYFTLLPGESKTVTIETAADMAPANLAVTVSGWNTDSRTYHFRQ